MNASIPSSGASRTGAVPIDGRLDTRAFRNALGTFATGVAVLTTISAGEAPIGITVNSFSSISLEPPLILVSIGYSNRSYSQFEKCRYFAVNVLSADQQEISRRFATSGEDKWRDIPLRYGVFGCPLLDKALSIFECEVEQRYDAGDHVMLLGKIVAFDYEANGAPLLFYRGGYGLMSPSLK